MNDIGYPERFQDEISKIVKEYSGKSRGPRVSRRQVVTGAVAGAAVAFLAACAPMIFTPTAPAEAVTPPKPDAWSPDDIPGSIATAKRMVGLYEQVAGAPQINPVIDIYDDTQRSVQDQIPSEINADEDNNTIKIPKSALKDPNKKWDVAEQAVYLDVKKQPVVQIDSNKYRQFLRSIWGRLTGDEGSAISIIDQSLTDNISVFGFDIKIRSAQSRLNLNPLVNETTSTVIIQTIHRSWLPKDVPIPPNPNEPMINFILQLNATAGISPQNLIDYHRNSRLFTYVRAIVNTLIPTVKNLDDASQDYYGCYVLENTLKKIRAGNFLTSDQSGQQQAVDYFVKEYKRLRNIK